MSAAAVSPPAPPRPYTIAIPGSVLADLRARLARTRFAPADPAIGWSEGIDPRVLADLVAWWKDGFDWALAERALNAFEHRRWPVENFVLHFVHARGRGPRPFPIVLTHGWPSTFFEMSKLIPRLADPARFGGDPADAFDVVVPSLPGFGFSERPHAFGLTTRKIADLWARLMTEGLGYARFAAHGGDIGAGVTTALGMHHADRVVGIHLTAAATPWLGEGSAPLSNAEQAYVALNVEWEADEGGYSAIQGTRPYTLAAGLADSPVGLLAWIAEKYQAWSDCGGDLLSAFTREEILTQATLYWATNTIYSSVRLYCESRRGRTPLGPDDRVRVPTAFLRTREAVDRAPREWVERTYDLERFGDLARGGHFAALEAPDALAEDLRAFFRPLRANVR